MPYKALYISHNTGLGYINAVIFFRFFTRPITYFSDRRTKFFFLKQGLKQSFKKQHVLLACSICAISDAILIVFGVSGFGVIVEKYPAVEPFSRDAGAAFYIFMHLKVYIPLIA
ncbi:MAG: LysE family transporter [Oceanospirillaceae bacterium]